MVTLKVALVCHKNMDACQHDYSFLRSKNLAFKQAYGPGRVPRQPLAAMFPTSDILKLLTSGKKVANRSLLHIQHPSIFQPCVQTIQNILPESHHPYH